MRIALLCLALVLAGCSGDVRRESANSAATIYEAALAVEQGVPAQMPLAAIKINALAIIKAQGYTYTPGSATQAATR